MAGSTVHGGLKWLCDQNDTVFIARDQRGTVAGQVEQVRAALGERPLTIFPEGTTADGIGPAAVQAARCSSAVEPLAHEVTDPAGRARLRRCGRDRLVRAASRASPTSARSSRDAAGPADDPLPRAAGGRGADQPQDDGRGGAGRDRGSVAASNPAANRLRARPMRQPRAPRDLPGQELRLPDERLRRRAHGRAAGRARACARPREGDGRRPRRAQHLPHPREGGGEGLFGHRPAGEGGRRQPADDRGRRLRGAGRGRGDHGARAGRRRWSSARRPITACPR